MSEESVKQESAVIKQSFGNKKIVLFSAIFAIAIIAIIAAVFIISSLNPNASGRTEKFSTSSGLEEIDLALNDGVSSVLASIDFSKLDSERPIDFIDIDKINKETERILNRFVYLGMPIPDESIAKPGYKNHSAFDLSFETGVASDRSTIEVKMDIYQEYTEEYDYELQKRFLDQSLNASTANNDELFKYIEDNFMDIDNLKTLFQGQNVLIEGEFDVSASQSTLSLKFDLLTINDEGYFVLKSVSAESVNDSGFEQLVAIEGRYFSIDMAEVIVGFFENIWPQIESNPAFNQSFNTNTQDLNDSLEQFNSLLTYMDSDVIDAIQRTGDPIKNVISNSVNKLKLFPEIKEADAIRQTQNKCVSGDVDLKNLVTVFGEGYREIMEIILNDSATTISQSAKDRMLQELDIQLSILPLSTSFIDMQVRTCSDAEKNLAGGGLSLNINVPGSNFELSLDTLNVENDFDKVIEAPQNAEDGTQSILDLLENTNFNFNSTFSTGVF